MKLRKAKTEEKLRAMMKEMTRGELYEEMEKFWEADIKSRLSYDYAVDNLVEGHTEHLNQNAYYDVVCENTLGCIESAVESTRERLKKERAQRPDTRIGVARIRKTIEEAGDDLLVCCNEFVSLKKDRE